MWYVRDLACHLTCALASLLSSWTRKKKRGSPTGTSLVSAHPEEETSWLLPPCNSLTKQKFQESSVCIPLQWTQQNTGASQTSGEALHHRRNRNISPKSYLSTNSATEVKSGSAWQNVCPASGKKNPPKFKFKHFRWNKCQDTARRGSCPTVAQSQPSPLEYSCRGLQDFKGSLGSQQWAAPSPPTQAELFSSNSRLAQPSLTREGTENSVCLAFHCSALPGQHLLGSCCSRSQEKMLGF